MSEPIQAEPIAAAGSEDADLQAAFPDAFPSAEPAADAPPIDPPAADAPPVTGVPEPDPDFTFATLENGQREMRLATGQVYRGKDDAELYGQLAKAQIAASRRITELSARPEPVAPPAATPTASEAIDPTALAIADLMAPAFGVKNGAELVAAFAEQQRIANAQSEYMAAQAVNMEAANFFRAVPEFSKSQADADRIDALCKQNGWAPTANNFEAAYHVLKSRGEMTAAPATTRTTAPKNNMPPPPSGTAPANTGKGAPTEQDLWAMSTEDLEALITGQLTQ